MRTTNSMHPTIYVPSGTPFETLVRLERALSRSLQADTSSPSEDSEEPDLVHAQHARRVA